MYIKKSFILLCLLFSTAVFAGECIDGEEAYLAEAQGSAMSFEGTVHALFCLTSESVPYYVMGHKTPFQKRDSLEEARLLSSPHRQFVLDRTKYLLDQPTFPKDLRLPVLKQRLLVGDSASWSEASEIIKNLPASDREDSQNYLAMVVGLGKIEAAIDWIVATDQEAKNKYKSKPIFSLPTRMTCLNALAYIDVPKSWELVKKYSEDSAETPEIRDHAMKLIKTLASPAGS